MAPVPVVLLRHVRQRPLAREVQRRDARRLVALDVEVGHRRRNGTAAPPLRAAPVNVRRRVRRPPRHPVRIRARPSGSWGTVWRTARALTQRWERVIGDRAVARDRPLALARVVDDRRRVVAADHAAGGLLLVLAHRPRLGQPLERHVAQLGAPAAHVRAVGVVAPLLGHRVVEAAEVRRGIDADRRDPLPVAVVLRLVAAQQVAHEVRLAEPPVEVQVLGQERGDDQPRAVVHPALARAAGACRRRRRDSRCGPRARRRARRRRPPTRARRTAACSAPRALPGWCSRTCA